MGKNRLEAAFKSSAEALGLPQGSPSGQGPQGGGVGNDAIITEGIAGNYMALAITKMRWEIIDAYQRIGKLEDVWQDPVFNIMDKGNTIRFFAFNRAPRNSDSAGTTVLMSHYEAVVQRLKLTPDFEADVHKVCTIEEVYMCLATGVTAETCEMDCESGVVLGRLMFFCLEHVLGFERAKAFVEMHNFAYLRDKENVGKTNPDDPNGAEGVVPQHRFVPRLMAVNRIVENWSDKVRAWTKEHVHKLQHIVMNYRREIDIYMKDGEQATDLANVESIMEVASYMSKLRGV